MKRRDDSSDTDALAAQISLPDAAWPGCMGLSKMIGDLLWFKNRDGRFVLLESLLDNLANTKKCAGLEGFDIARATCLFELRNPRFACDARWTFGDDERWRADQCCGILALHKANWTAGKRIPDNDTFQWALNDRINRLLVLCLPPEDIVATGEQTWTAVCKEEPWKAGQNAPLRCLIRCPDPAGTRYRVLASDDMKDGGNASEIDTHTSLSVVRKRVMAPRVAEHYVRLSTVGDILPWLRNIDLLRIAGAEDAGLAQTVAHCIAQIARRPAVLADDGRAAAKEAEICQKMETEIAFRNRLVAALDKAGYAVKGSDTRIDERTRVALREKYENEPDPTSRPWNQLLIHSKDESAAFRLSVWFSSDEPTPTSFKWRSLGVECLSFAGPSKRSIKEGVLSRDVTPPLCYHVALIDARLRFERLPLPAMRDTLLGGGLAEELASKIALAFDRISAIRAGTERGGC